MVQYWASTVHAVVYLNVSCEYHMPDTKREDKRLRWTLHVREGQVGHF